MHRRRLRAGKRVGLAFRLEPGPSRRERAGAIQPSARPSSSSATPPAEASLQAGTCAGAGQRRVRLGERGSVLAVVAVARDGFLTWGVLVTAAQPHHSPAVALTALVRLRPRGRGLPSRRRRSPRGFSGTRMSCSAASSTLSAHPTAFAASANEHYLTHSSSIVLESRDGTPSLESTARDGGVVHGCGQAVPSTVRAV